LIANHVECSAPTLLTAEAFDMVRTSLTTSFHEGIDIHIVSERLNHSSTHVTREIYTHVTPPMQSDAGERVAQSFLRSPRRVAD